MQYVVYDLNCAITPTKFINTVATLFWVIKTFRQEFWFRYSQPQLTYFIEIETLENHWLVLLESWFLLWVIKAKLYFP